VSVVLEEKNPRHDADITSQGQAHHGIHGPATVLPLPNTMTDMVQSNFPKLSAIFAEIDPIKKIVNSHKNHEFIPPNRMTKKKKMIPIGMSFFVLSFSINFVVPSLV
jgi:hypothetical protein